MAAGQPQDTLKMVWHMPDVMHWDAVSYIHTSMHACIKI